LAVAAQVPTAAASGAHKLIPTAVEPAQATRAAVKQAALPTPPLPGPVTPPPAVKTPTVPVKTPPPVVKTPTVPVKTPTVPVKTPTVPVKTPTAPVKVPPPVLKTPTVPVKTPTVTVKTPTVTVKTPAVRTPTVPTTAPSARAPAVPAPTVRVETPAVRAGSPLRRARAGAVPAPTALVLSRASAAAAGRVLADPELAPTLGPSLERAETAAAPLGAPGGAIAFTPQEIARLLLHGHAMLDNPRVRAYVLGLKGCLSQIPARLRTVLRLRAGVGARRPLSAREVGARLHISRRRLGVLELRALRGLSRAARTTGCARREAAAATALRFVPGGFVGRFVEVGAGGVAGGLYFREPAEPSAEPQPPGGEIRPPALHVTPGDNAPLLWALLAALAGALLVGYLIRSEMGFEPPSFGRKRRRRSGASRRRGGSDGD
jgi:hypothetical protein